jgi:hypothetical protein
MNGIVFAGCSFTWGQGLYYYSNLKHIPKFEEWVKDYGLMTNAPINYKNTIRFPRLVANHFSTFEVCRETNGGSDEMSFKFLEILFTRDKVANNLQHYSFLTSQFYEYDEIEYIVFQSSQPQRCSYKINYDGKQYLVYINDNSSNRTRVSVLQQTGLQIDLNEEEGLDIVYKWLEENNLTVDELYDLHIKNQVDIMKNNFMFYESKGIKIKLLLWTNDLLNSILKDDYLKSKLITLNHNGFTFSTIDEMFDYDATFLIERDIDGFDGVVPDIAKGDRHPSKRLNQILAKNIIKSIEMDTKQKPLI